MKSRQDILKILLISGAVVLGIAMALAINVAVFMSLKPQSPKVSREAKLAVFMPKQPEATQFAKEGYNPRSHCFDKCGYLYRSYSYTDQAAICKNLFAVLLAESRDVVITSPSVKEPPTESWCETKIGGSLSFTLEVEAPVVLKNGRHESSRTIVSAVVMPAQKTIEYRVSEINEGITLAR